LEILGIKRSRFFVLLQQYKACPDTFSIQYGRKAKTRKISESIEHNIIKELHIEKDMITEYRNTLATLIITAISKTF